MQAGALLRGKVEAVTHEAVIAGIGDVGKRGDGAPVAGRTEVTPPRGCFGVSLRTQRRISVPFKRWPEFAF